MTNNELARLVAADTTGATMGEAEQLTVDERVAYIAKVFGAFGDDLKTAFGQMLMPRSTFATSILTPRGPNVLTFESIEHLQWQNRYATQVAPDPFSWRKHAFVLRYPLAIYPDNVREMG